MKRKRNIYMFLSFFIPIYFIIVGIVVFELFIRLAATTVYRRFEPEDMPPYPHFLEISFWSLVIIYFLVGALLIWLLTRYFNKLSYSFLSKWLIFLALAFLGYIVGYMGFKYYYEAPPMSKEKALQIAIKENESDASKPIFRSITWDDHNYEWVIKY